MNADDMSYCLQPTGDSSSPSQLALSEGQQVQSLHSANKRGGSGYNYDNRITTLTVMTTVTGGQCNLTTCPIPPHMDGPMLFTRWRQCAPSNTCFLDAIWDLDLGFPTSHQPRFYDARPNFLKMGIKYLNLLSFIQVSTIKNKKSAAKFHYTKTVSGKVVVQSIAFRVVSIYWQGVAPFP